MNAMNSMNANDSQLTRMPSRHCGTEQSQSETLIDVAARLFCCRHIPGQRPNGVGFAPGSGNQGACQSPFFFPKVGCEFIFDFF
jgi:hypothetical protein